MYNENVDLKYSLEYLENEIKEISGRWTGFMINKMALEKAIQSQKPTSTIGENLLAEMDSKKPSDQKRALEKMTKEEKAEYNNALNNDRKKHALEEVIEGIQEFKDFLEIAQLLKKELSK